MQEKGDIWWEVLKNTKRPIYSYAENAGNVKDQFPPCRAKRVDLCSRIDIDFDAYENETVLDIEGVILKEKFAGEGAGGRYTKAYEVGWQEISS